MSTKFHENIFEILVTTERTAARLLSSGLPPPQPRDFCPGKVSQPPVCAQFEPILDPLSSAWANKNPELFQTILRFQKEAAITFLGVRCSGWTESSWINLIIGQGPI